MARPPSSDESMAEVLLEAYLEMSLTEGIHTLNLRHLAKHADVAYSTVYYYFGPPKNIVVEAANYVGQNAQKFVRHKMEAALWDANQSAVNAYIDANFDWLKNHYSHAVFWLYCIHLGGGRSVYHDKIQQRFMDGQKHIVEVIKLERQRRGCPALKKQDIEVISKSLHALLLGSIIQAAIDPSDVVKTYKCNVLNGFEVHLK